MYHDNHTVRISVGRDAETKIVYVGLCHGLWLKALLTLGFHSLSILSIGYFFISSWDGVHRNLCVEPLHGVPAIE